MVDRENMVTGGFRQGEPPKDQGGAGCLVQLERLLLLRWCLRLFLQQSRFLGDHVGNAVCDGVGDAELLVDQLVGFGLIPAWTPRQF